MTESDFIKNSIEDNIVFVTIDRSPVNVLGFAHFEMLCQSILEFVERKDIRAIILSGNDKVFVSGFDIKEIAVMKKPDQVKQATMQIKHLLTRIETAGKPIIAAVRGSCFGGGFELMLACHLRIAADEARLALPEINLATIPTFGGTVRLPKIIGRARALEMILTGKIISGEEAFRIGLVNKVCKGEELLSTAKSLARSISEKGALAVEAAIKSVIAANELDTEQAMKLESELSGYLVETKDLKDNIAAFFEKKRAVS
ncbi:MAG: enoyl-CoA hydratase [Syntrophus sp. (in: bacteria)]|nr:enoyl-CoA hydratase [Syntrophus sp. (in: bacteria)]